MMAKKVPSWMDNPKGAKEVGDVKIYACSMTMELFDMNVRTWNQWLMTSAGWQRLLNAPKRDA